MDTERERERELGRLLPILRQAVEELTNLLAVFDGRAGRRLIEDARAAVAEAERLRPRVMALAEAVTAPQVALEQARFQQQLELRRLELEQAERSEHSKQMAEVMSSLSALLPMVLKKP